MKVLVIGSNGQLGTDLVQAFSAKPSMQVTGLTHNDLDVSDPSARSEIVGRRPDVVINTAAFHRTDACEDEPQRAFQVNAVGSRNVAVACKEAGALCVYASTDYVFSGEKNQPYTEDDIPGPINVYGVSKLAGEELVSEYSPKHYIVRSSSLFGRAGASGKGGNFVETMIGKASRKEDISVVDDITMSPTNTMDLALGVGEMIEKQVPFGVYHLTNKGFCSWWEFAKEIVHMAGFDAVVNRTSSAAYPTRARRPKMSALVSTKLADHQIELRHWRDALRAYLQAKGHLSGDERHKL